MIIKSWENRSQFPIFNAILSKNMQFQSTSRYRTQCQQWRESISDVKLASKYEHIRRLLVPVFKWLSRLIEDKSKIVGSLNSFQSYYALHLRSLVASENDSLLTSILHKCKMRGVSALFVLRRNDTGDSGVITFSTALVQPWHPL